MASSRKKKRGDVYGNSSVVADYQHLGGNLDFGLPGGAAIYRRGLSHHYRHCEPVLMASALFEEDSAVAQQALEALDEVHSAFHGLVDRLDFLRGEVDDARRAYASKADRDRLLVRVQNIFIDEDLLDFP